MKNIRIDLKPSYVLKGLLIIIGTLLLFNCIALISDSLYGHQYLNWTKKFNFNLENNFPSIYSTVALFAAALILWLISHGKKKLNEPFKMWFLLCVIFFYLGIDESISIHERLSVFLTTKFSFKGFLYYAWVVPFGILVIIMAYFYYFKFIVHLPKKYKKLIIQSGGIFVLGAIGIEMIEAKFTFDGISKSTPIHMVMYTFEELFEMLGVAIFIYTLLLYIKDEMKVEINLPLKS